VVRIGVITIGVDRFNCSIDRNYLVHEAGVLLNRHNTTSRIKDMKLLRGRFIDLKGSRSFSLVFGGYSVEISIQQHHMPLNVLTH